MISDRLQLPQRRHRAEQGRPGRERSSGVPGRRGAGRDAWPRRWAETKRAEVGDPVALSGLHQVRSAGGGVALAQPPVARAHFAAPLSSSSRTRGPTSASATRTPVAGQNSPAPTRRDDSRSLCGDIHLRVEPCTDSVGFVPKVTTDATRRRSEALPTPLVKGLHGDSEIGGYINWRP